MKYRVRAGKAKTFLDKDGKKARDQLRRGDVIEVGWFWDTGYGKIEVGKQKGNFIHQRDLELFAEPEPEEPEPEFAIEYDDKGFAGKWIRGTKNEGRRLVMPDGSIWIPHAQPSTPIFDLPPGYKLFCIKHDLETGEGDQTFNAQSLRFKRNGLRKRRPEVYNLERSGKIEIGPEATKLSYDLFIHFAKRLGKLEHPRWRQLYAWNRAFTNDKGGKGFDNPNPGIPPTRDYIINKDLDGEPLTWDDNHICGGATIAGKVSGQLVTDILTIDVNNVPSLQYVLARPYLYFFAMNCGANSVPHDFPQGSISSQDIYDPVAVPLFADHSKGKLSYPLKWVRPVTEISNPYHVPY